MHVMLCIVVVFFFKHKTAYEWRISDWSSDVCASDLLDSLHQTDERDKYGGQTQTRPATIACLQPRSGVMWATQAFFWASRSPRIPDGRKISRSEKRRVGKECVRTFRSGWSREP